MDRIRIRGGAPLNGLIPISGAKNAALPLMIASLLTEETLELGNVPRLADISSLLRIMSNFGVDHSIAGRRPGQSSETGQTIRLTAKNIIDTAAPYELVSTMRASFWVIAPLVARFGHARVSMPGGCAIGTRPVDLLIMALAKLGAAIEIDSGYVVATRSEGPDRGRDRLSQGDGRRHPCRPDGGNARSRHHRDPQRRPRAGGGGSGRVPDQDGRQDRRSRHLRDRRRGRRSPQRRVARRDARPHRDRHLCHGGCHDRRRPRARQHPAGLSPGRPRRARPGRGPK